MTDLVYRSVMRDIKQKILNNESTSGYCLNKRAKSVKGPTPNKVTFSGLFLIASYILVAASPGSNKSSLAFSNSKPKKALNY